MNDATDTADEEVVRLRALVETQRLALAAVNEELAETNNGVVALYAELDDRAEELRHVSELKSRFLSYMSHEFRTPLGSIASISRILLDLMDGPLTEEQVKQVRFIQDSANELTDMVNDLLDLAKVEAGRITISPGWFDMVDLFSALRGMFRPITVAEDVDLIFVEPVGVPRLYTDHKKLSQILRNFVSNSLKFTSEGSIHVTAIHDATSQMVTFAVADTGIGIAKEHQKDLFNDFVQIDSTIQKRLRGTGLGLSLSNKFAQILGGRIDVESDLGQGSTFSLTIPVHLEGAAGTWEPVED